MFASDVFFCVFDRTKTTQNVKKWFEQPKKKEDCEADHRKTVL